MSDCACDHDLDTGYCRCTTIGTEPCPSCQGEIPWPPRCGNCGQFIGLSFFQKVVRDDF